MAKRILWYGRSFERHLLRQTTKALRAGGEAYRDEIKDTIDTIGPPRSDPSQPPHVDSSELLKSVITSVSAARSSSVVCRTGSTSEHAIYLEHGTRNMSPRPFILSTLLRSESIIVGAMQKAVI